MPRTKTTRTSTLPDLISVLYDQVDAIKSGRADLRNAKMLNQTSHQIMNGYKLQITAHKALGAKRNVALTKGLLT